MKPADIKSSRYIDFPVDNEILNLKLVISKYKNIFAKGYTRQIGLKKFL